MKTNMKNEKISGNLKDHFECPEDVPEIPILNNTEEKQSLINKLIELGAIPKKDLVIGKTYVGSCRNSEEAVWNGEKFIYKRTKFGITYDEKINHFEDDDGYDVFIPIK